MDNVCPIQLWIQIRVINSDKKCVFFRHDSFKCGIAVLEVLFILVFLVIVCHSDLIFENIDFIGKNQSSEVLFIIFADFFNKKLIIFDQNEFFFKIKDWKKYLLSRYHLLNMDRGYLYNLMELTQSLADWAPPLFTGSNWE